MTDEKDIPEADVENYLVRRVRRMGGRSYKLKFASVRGAPDRIVLLPRHGVHGLVETKRPKGGKLSLHQVRIHKELRDSGVSVYVLNSKQLIDDFLTEVCAV